MVNSTILIIDDEEQLRKLLSRIISLEGYEVEESGTLKGGMDILNKKNIDLLLCDVKLPDGNGVDFVKTAKGKFPLLEIIVLTAYGNIADGVQAIKNGAFDYITKGNDNDRIIPLLNQAIDKVKSNRKSAVKINDKATIGFEDILGSSIVIKEAIALARRIATNDTTVLLLGETGTGKEVFANAIHSCSRRAGKSIIAINCSAFSKDLLEGELFGYKAGAYTDARKDKKGLIEVADEGTLFLDEIGEMNIELQAKLLRVLENGEFIKLGDVRTTKVDVRIIAATNRELGKSVREKHFREDLYYRLNGFSIELPAMRDRVEDIPLLAEHFLSHFSAKAEKKGVHFSNEAMKLLKVHTWNGNIRELRNVVERATILTDTNIILPDHLPYEIQKQSVSAPDNLSLAFVESKHIERVLEHTRGNKTKSAELLGIGLTTLYRKMEEYHIGK